MSNQGQLLQRFHDLHDYIRLIGEHINQIYKKIEALETNLETITNEHNMLIDTNKHDIETVNEIMVTKSEITNLMQDLNNSISGLLPTLPNSNKDLERQDAPY